MTKFINYTCVYIYMHIYIYIDVSLYPNMGNSFQMVLKGSQEPPNSTSAEPKTAHSRSRPDRASSLRRSQIGGRGLSAVKACGVSACPRCAKHRPSAVLDGLELRTGRVLGQALSARRQLVGAILW